MTQKWSWGLPIDKGRAVSITSTLSAVIKISSSHSLNPSHVPVTMPASDVTYFNERCQQLWMDVFRAGLTLSPPCMFICKYASRNKKLSSVASASFHRVKTATNDLFQTTSITSLSAELGKMLVVQSSLTLFDPMDSSLSIKFCPLNSQGKNTAVDCHSILQGIFPTQESNLSLLHCRQILYHLVYLGSPLCGKYLSNLFVF